MLDREREYFELSPNPENIRWKQDGKFFYFDGSPVEEAKKESKPESTNIEDLPWQKVKSLVIEAGGEWTTKAAGIEYLKG